MIGRYRCPLLTSLRVGPPSSSPSDMELVHGAEMGGGAQYEVPTEVLQVDGAAPEQAHAAYVAFRGWSEDSKRRLDAQVVRARCRPCVQVRVRTPICARRSAQQGAVSPCGLQSAPSSGRSKQYVFDS